MNKRNVIFIGLLFLASCNYAKTPAPVFHYDDNQGAGGAGMVTVEPGDTPDSLAADYHVMAADIIAANNLQPPYQLTPGQRLQLPAPLNYRAQAGDTVASVAHLFNVDPGQVAQLNTTAPNAPFTAGQIVHLPSAHMQVAAAAPTTPSTAPSTSPPNYAPPYYGYGAPATATPSQMPPQPYVNQQNTTAQSAPLPILPDDRDIAMSSTVDEVARDIASEPPLPVQQVAPPPLNPVQDTDLPAGAIPWQDGGGRFAWPVNGNVTSTYGNKAGGLHNDGINIAAVRGTPVHAAAGGEVVYAGNDLKGFGNLVLLRHPDRWVTAYAHLSHLAVARGDNVARGQVLGTVGSTGAVSSPQLHFEIRHGTEALNPVVFLGSASP